MDSLLANYASSGEEEEGEEGGEREKQKQPQSFSSSSSSLFASLPQPSFSLPQPPPISKRVIQFRPPPINPSISDPEDDEDAHRTRRKESQSSSSTSFSSSSVKSFLSSIPAPKNSFSALGSRRSMIDSQLPTSAPSEAFGVENYSTSTFPKFDPDASNYANDESGVGQTHSQNGALESFPNSQPPTSSSSDTFGSENRSTSNFHTFDTSAANYAHYGSGYGENLAQNVDAGYGSYGGYGQQYGSDLGYGPTAAIPETESAVRTLGKRAKHEIPTDIVEVKQDELMKNRPKEGQSKLTGIAFGPSYQPVSTKGKPSKLHKRKHQIGSLYFDMKQKEMELAERRAKGFLTKAETHAKYGW